MSNLNQQLLAYAMEKEIKNKVENMNFDINSIAIEILQKIQNVLIESDDDEDDFYTVDKIVCFFMNMT